MYMARRLLHHSWLLAALLLCGCSTVPGVTMELFNTPEPRRLPFRLVLPEPSADIAAGDLLTRGICASLDDTYLVDEGDMIEYIEQVSLFIDDADLPDSDMLVFVNDVGFVNVTAQGWALSSGPTEQTNCWQVALEPGIHLAEVEVISSSGARSYSYRWAFRVVPDSG